MFDLVARLRLQDDFSAKMRKATDQMGKAQKATGGLTSGVKKFISTTAGISAAIGLTAALSKGFNMVTSSIGSAFDRIDTMESFERVLTTLTGSTEKTNAALEATRKAVTGTAYGMDTAAKGVQDFVTRGMEVSKATDTMAAWGDAVAFYGDGSNEQLAGVADSLAKMTSSGKVSMQNMNTLYNAGIDGVGMFAKAVGRDVDAVQKDLSSGAITAETFIDTVSTAMMEGTNGVHQIAGAAQEAGASWGASFDNMRAAVTRGVVKIIETIDKMLTDNGLPEMREMIADFGSKFEDVLNKVAEFVPPLVDKIKGIYDKVKVWFPEIIETVIGLGVAFLTFKGIMAGMAVIGTVTRLLEALRLGTLKATLAQMGLNTAMLLNPMTWIVIGIAAVIAAGVLLYRNWDTVKEKMGELWSKIKEVFGNLGTWFAEKWEAVKTATSEAVASMGEAISTGFTAAKDWMVNSLQAAWDFVVWFFRELPAIAVEKMAYTVGVIVGWISQLPSLFSEWFSSAVAWAGNAISVLPGLIGGFLSNVWTTSVQWLADLASSFSEWFGTAKDNALEHVKELPGKIAGFLAEVPGKISGAISAIWDKFKELGSAIPKAIAEGFNSAVAGLGKAAKWAIDKVAGGVSNLASLGKSAGASFGAGFETGSGNIDGSHYSGLTRVPFDGYIARLHRGERVLTRQEADAMDGRSSKSHYHGIDYVPNYGGDTYNNQTYNNEPSSKGVKEGGGNTFQFGDINLHGVEGNIEKAADELMEIMYRKVNAAGMAGA